MALPQIISTTSSNHKNLIWYNENGDYLNFNYNSISDRFEGNIIFDVNSTDTFKTYGLYMFENVPTFEYQSNGLTLDKFQLFNQFGINMYGSMTASQKVTLIEPVNNHPDYYSKWVHGVNFESLFPIGTHIVFNSPVMEFTNSNQSFVVVSTKKNAILILSLMDNYTFYSTYQTIYPNPSTYNNVTISGINVIGVYKYIDETYHNNLSNWSEPNFYDNIYIGRRLCLVNTSNNQNSQNLYGEKIVTIINDSIPDTLKYEYKVSNIPPNNLIIEVKTHTDLPMVYNGEVTLISNSNTISFESDPAPISLQPGITFTINVSISNNGVYTIGPISQFAGNNTTYYYATQSLVIYNNKVYECLQAYTQEALVNNLIFGTSGIPMNSSYVSGASAYLSGPSITPDNGSYWTQSTFLPVVETLVDETLLSSQVYLTSDTLYFEQTYTQSSAVTLAMAAQTYESQFKLFNIDLYLYNNNILRADLMYPTRYADVNFYSGQVGPTFSIGNIYSNYEKLLAVEELLTNELNYNISSNYSYNIVFTQLDQYGIIITINKQVYQIEIEWVYTNGVVDMVRTIDRTLTNWLNLHTISLASVGIFITVQYIGSYTSVFNNSIVLKTQYPNVPLNFNVKVGTTAAYHIEHSRILFNDMGGYLGVTINNRDYSIPSVYSGSTASIPLTLQAWCSSYSEILLSYGIYVSNINNMLKFDVISQSTILVYKFSIGKSTLPGLHGFTITSRIAGNQGMIITSNSIILPDDSTDSFDNDGFATGMALSVNNTNYPLDNQEYCITGLFPTEMNLSYQGPFWGLTNSLCNISPYITVAFSTGFGQTACGGPTQSGTYSYGPFYEPSFDLTSFSVTYNPNIYNSINYSSGSNLVDIIYIQLSNSIYAFGDNINVYDSLTSDNLGVINLTGNTQSIKMAFNDYNNYLYALSVNLLWVIDPMLDSIVTSIDLVGNASDIVINQNNGDIYISYSNTEKIQIYKFDNTLLTTITNWGTTGGAFNMTYNSYENVIYVVTNDISDIALRINGNGRNIEDTYNIPGLSSMTQSAYNIYYEPINDSIYIYGSASLYNISNKIVGTPSIPSKLSVPTQTFNQILFNNINDEIYISDSSLNFTELDINSGNIISSSDIFNYGYMGINQYDGDIYISSQFFNKISVINPLNMAVIQSIPMSSATTKLVYNPDRQSMWLLQPSINQVVEVEVSVNTYLNISSSSQSQVAITQSQYGTLDPNYVPYVGLWLKTRQYIRYPRENFSNEPVVSYYYRWLTDNVPEMFLYDFSGTQLPTSGKLGYNGPIPLNSDNSINLSLNSVPNSDLTRTSDPTAQQTVFDRLYYQLQYLDLDVTNIYEAPTPLETFIGFNSTEEGALRSVLQLFKRESILFEIDSSSTSSDVISFSNTYDSNGNLIGGLISLNTHSNSFFTIDSNNNTRALKVGQLLRIDVYDKTNIKKQYISRNSGRIFRITGVYSRMISIEFLRRNDSLFTENTVVLNYPSNGLTTYLGVRFTIIDREIGRFNVMGQTEEEDIRFKTELGNVGKLIGSDEVFIFKEYDINEGGSDWVYLNKKRKEMLMNKHLIYPYIGSYKSIINAINFFGYNDLELNEYYQNTNNSSPNFGKLFTVEIPDIFDNSVPGWTENDWLSYTLPNPNYKKTNLFNLTFDITDKSGNDILIYTLSEVQTKLEGLKHWLQRNIIPLTHKILDITGKAYFVGSNTITHRSYEIQSFVTTQSMSPIISKMNEAYLLPINNGSTQYNCVLDFYALTTASNSSPLSTFKQASTSSLPTYYNISVKTYKTYPEWQPFVIYNIGDMVIYYDQLYESTIGNNKINNPLKYSNASPWGYPDNITNFSFKVGQVYEYNNYYYEYTGISIGTSSSTYSTITPNNDPGNWINVTQWTPINYMPVQKISEYRLSNNMNPFNFTIDSNIDPFISIEITSDNGYGQIYTDKKNYEVRGLVDITNQNVVYPSIGSFVPIYPNTKTVPYNPSYSHNIYIDLQRKHRIL